MLASRVTIQVRYQLTSRTNEAGSANVGGALPTTFRCAVMEESEEQPGLGSWTRNSDGESFRLDQTLEI